jgi:hypothetical protein
MSVTTTDETLVTCPDCGQAGFSPRGLAAHRGSKHCTRRSEQRGTSSEKSGPTSPQYEAPVDLFEPAALTVHPLLAHIPEHADHSPAFTALMESVRDQGILQPALIDADNRVLCGRHRRRAAIHLGLRLPCRRVDGAHAAGVILNELCVSRHLCKGALALLSVPLLEPALDEARERRIAILKSGGKPSIADSIGHAEQMGISKAAIAARLGISKDTLEQAEKLRDLLELVAQRVDKNRARAIYDQVIAGVLGLGYALTAAANYLKGNTDGGDSGKRQEHARLFVQSFNRICLHWDKATSAQRDLIRRELVTVAKVMPEELRADLRRVLK